jgi:hypothetical protein
MGPFHLSATAATTTGGIDRASSSSLRQPGRARCIGPTNSTDDDIAVTVGAM